MAPKGNKRKYGNQGIITVFVTLMMVPVVAISGVMVDVARLKLYSSQAAMAADSYGDAVLSEFDNPLKELYGLFSITQNEKGIEEIKNFAKYASYSFRPDGDGKEFSGFMPYKDAEMEVAYEKVDGASLSNNNVLMTQISDFMKYRIIEDVLEETGILNSLAEFDNLSADTEAMETRSDITDNSTEALKEIDEYYLELKKLAEYPSYLNGREHAFLSYSREMTNIVNSEEYRKYFDYLKNSEEIESVREEFDAMEETESEEPDDTGMENEGESETGAEAESEPDESLAARVELYDRFKDFDVERYKEDLDKKLRPLSGAANSHDSSPIDFDNAEAIIDNLKSKAEKIEKTLRTIEEQVNRLENQLEECSEDVAENMRKEISDLKDIADAADDFRETYELIAVIHDNRAANRGNKEFMETEVPRLDKAKEDILSGRAEAGKSPWPRTTAFFWYDFRDNKGSFYSWLQELCGSGGGSGGDKDAGDREISRANQIQEDAEKKLDEDENTAARNISSGLASQLKSGGGSSENVPDFTDYFAGGLSFDALARAGGNVLDKFLVTSYDFGMFSSRVSGIRPKEEKSQKTDEKYEDYSLTKVKMSPDINYLYGAELEYLFGGHNKSKSNLNHTRNVICGIRMTFNFASSYVIEEINSAINAIASSAATAVAATGVGAAAAPLVRVAVSGALRTAFATIETVADWSSLKSREDVILFKKKLEELQSIDAICSLLNIEIDESSEKERLGLSYEDYLYILLCLLVDDNTLLSRTSNLITLNVNQAQNQSDTLTTLKFKMSDTVTAIKSTCKVRTNFVVLPENIAELYYSNTETEALIEVLEEHYFGYSVIRGY